jgi:uncharacterized Tic20 family protein
MGRILFTIIGGLINWLLKGCKTNLVDETGYGNKDENKRSKNYFLGVFFIIIFIILIYML